MPQKAQSILYKFGGIQGGVIIVLFAVFTTLSAVSNWDRQSKSFAAQTEDQAQLLGFAVAPQLYSYSQENAKRVIGKFLEKPQNLRVQVLDDKAAVFVEQAKEVQVGQYRTVKLPLEYDGKPIGSLVVDFDAEAGFRELAASVLGQVVSNLILLAVILTTLILLLIRLILKPLRRLEEKLQTIAVGEGDLTHQLEVGALDEMGKVAGNFNQFLGKIRDLVVGIRQTLGEVLNIQDRLVSSTSETSSGLIEITSNIESIQKQIQRLDKEIQSAAEAVQASLSTIAQMGGRIDEQNRSLSGANEAMVSMVESVHKVAQITSDRRQNTRRLLEVTTLGGEKLRLTTDVVAEVNKNLGSISDMIKIINGISAQTNLLAMNAAIEAAHAGDAGRGFSVVADEIRKLAEHSATNSKGIGQILKTVVTRISETNTHALDTARVFEQIQREVGDVDQALGEIVSSAQELVSGGAQVQEQMGTLRASNEDVRRESAEMAARSQTMATGMDRVTDISAEVRVGMGEIADGTRAIALAVEAVNQQAHALAESSDRLGRDVGRFKVD